ncbi:valine--tRNA ligase [Acidicapsa dinghuensis]|uniref:Valine--tRNA ligase n=1 Tax=Acidicapsa dinghuensis TaxID=2218256 RepID=A0ABW1ECP3_9BACT|nr:valine--tRNA ligase [Acidicapsa dinghuensis]
MPHDLPKAYDPTAIEDKWAEYWVRENLFAVDTPTEKDGQEAFTILLPPPNVTGRLHMGHMLNQTEMDILIRWHRMRGEKALWVPGTDHAGIATQMMVERQLASEGSSRQQLGREAFEKRVWQWREQYGKAILDQMKRLGASVDWSREYFTMDAGLSVAVREAFTRLYHEGLVYRGAYVVNWCPGCQTAVSDLEVVHEEMLGKLWEIRYPVVHSNGEYLTIATTRPETMLGDVAVAIHPDDERYTHLHGKRLILPLTGREIPIVLDTWVSRDFGTGAVKVTPAHDPNDFALGQRHNLPSINVMDDRARIALPGSPYDGLDRYEARKRIVDDLAAEGLLGAIHDHKLSVGRCDRSKDVIEPRLSTQWFVAVNKRPEGRDVSMAELAIAAVQANEYGQQPMRFTPSMYEKTYLNWMTNIRDWCISRQLWWGHRIPAWHCAVCHQITVPKPGDAHDPSACTHCSSAEITQETDVLDTWFSSGLLPVSVFGWPFLAPDADGTASADFHNFYPTSLLVTGFDILFFWVARMVMLDCWFSQDVPLADGSKRTLKDSVPFREVYIHALVRDANREKMSKTKGNVIDPIEIVKQYGTDAVRFTLASMASPGTDIAFNVARTEGYRAFANKIWNAARFIFMTRDRYLEQTGGAMSHRFDLTKVDRHNSVLLGYPANPEAPASSESQSPLEHRWILSRLHRASAGVNAALESYRFDDAASVVYQFFWGDFCDWYLEIIKLPLDPVKPDGPEKLLALLVLLTVFESALRLLSPFLPFLTEELWHAYYQDRPPVKSIALMPFPVSEDPDFDEQADRAMEQLQNLIVEVRALRKESGVEEKATVPIELRIGADSSSTIEENRAVIERLARVSEIRFVDEISPSLTKRSTPDFDLAVLYERTIDVAAERDRLTKDIAKLEKNLASAEKQLGNESFLAKAPANIVEGLKKQYEENRQLLEKARAALSSLPPEA